MNDHEPIAVTVVCLTYNHSKYISACIDSLIKQNVNFKYEIIVHDDASTDGTTEIIQEYAKRFPELIVPILEKENLYSKGQSFSQHITPLIRGKYVCHCEGDDWWISSDKLQQQFDYMEAHGDCSLCVHGTVLYDDSLNCYVGLSPVSGKERDLSTENIIEKGGWYISTNSMFYQSCHYELPSVFSGWGVGDYPKAIYLSLEGRVHCISEIMSAYRVNARGSWTVRTNKSVNAKQHSNELIIKGLSIADAYSKYKFHTSFEKAQYALRKQILELRHDVIGLMFGEYSSYYWNLSLISKLRSLVKCLMPAAILAIAQRFKSRRNAKKMNSNFNHIEYRL